MDTWQYEYFHLQVRIYKYPNPPNPLMRANLNWPTSKICTNWALEPNLANRQLYALYLLNCQNWDKDRNKTECHSALQIAAPAARSSRALSFSFIFPTALLLNSRKPFISKDMNFVSLFLSLSVSNKQCLRAREKFEGGQLHAMFLKVIL